MQTMWFFSGPYFQWDIIKIDPDDNKFSDLAISANANYLITFDKHFDVFKEVEFPKLEVLSPSQFFKVL
jgi:predicted nucleic acid-binding protein